MNKRRTTVHDLTALSLHPAGSRAQPYHTNSLNDARGNWIAMDAGGWGAVPKRRVVDGVENDGEEEEEDEEDEDENEEDEDVDAENGKHNRRRTNDGGRNLKDCRAHKRRKLVHDVDFICGQTAPTEGDDTSLEPSIPSSDLLKQIHFFASRYYASQNILLDSSRMYRKDKKDKKAKQTKDAAEKKRKELRRDMYKVFDGSALMVIGMLLQHHTASLVRPCVPDGWEEEMTFGVGEKPRGGTRRRKGRRGERKRGPMEESGHEEARRGSGSSSVEEGSEEDDDGMKVESESDTPSDDNDELEEEDEVDV